MSRHRNRIFFFLYFVLPTVSVAVLLSTDRTSINSYAFAMALFAGVHLLLREKQELRNNFILYHIYLGVSIMLYKIFITQTPEFMGTTSVVPFDDLGFFAQMADDDIVVPYDWSEERKAIHQFAIFYRSIYPFPIRTPLNIIIVNILWTMLTPYYAKKLIYQLTSNEKAARLAFILTAICPYTTYFGCILLRESLVTTCVIASMYHMLRKNFLFVAVYMALLIYIRFGTIAYLLAGLLLLVRRHDLKTNKNSRRSIFLIILLIASFNIFYTFIQELSGGKLGDSVIREIEGSYWEDSTIYQLYLLPFPLNLLMTTVFFLFSPTFRIPGMVEGYYMPFSFASAFFTPMLFFFLWYPIVNQVLTYRRRNDVNAQFLVSIMLVFALLLGSIDLQIRHKTVLFPFMCMLAAYGYANFDKTQKYTSLTISTLFAVGQIFIAINPYL